MASQKNRPVAEVCLYGTSRIGAGWIAQTDAGLLGNGEPKAERGFTEAVFQAVSEILERQPGLKGTLAIFAPGGERVAYADLNHPGYYGDLKWAPAPVYTIDLSAYDNPRVNPDA